MEANAVDFVRYEVSDLGTSVPFYRDGLGLPLEARIDEHGWAEFALPPTTLALSETGSAGSDSKEGNGAAVAVAVEDVEEAVDAIREAGATIRAEPFETAVCDMAEVTDPDGNPIVLHRRHDGTHGRREPFP